MQTLPVHAKQSKKDARKVISKRIIQKMEEDSDDLIVNKRK